MSITFKYSLSPFIADIDLSEENRKLADQNRAPIIVSARKVAAALASAIACFGEQNPSATVPPTAVSTPPIKSVIVRAGPGPTTSSVRQNLLIAKSIHVSRLHLNTVLL